MEVPSEKTSKDKILFKKGERAILNTSKIFTGTVDMLVEGDIVEFWEDVRYSDLYYEDGGVKRESVFVKILFPRKLNGNSTFESIEFKKLSPTNLDIPRGDEAARRKKLWEDIINERITLDVAKNTIENRLELTLPSLINTGNQFFYGDMIEQIAKQVKNTYILAYSYNLNIYTKEEREQYDKEQQAIKQAEQERALQAKQTFDALPKVTVPAKIFYEALTLIEKMVNKKHYLPILEDQFLLNVGNNKIEILASDVPHYYAKVVYEVATPFSFCAVFNFDRVFKILNPSIFPYDELDIVLKEDDYKVILSWQDGKGKASQAGERCDDFPRAPEVESEYLGMVDLKPLLKDFKGLKYHKSYEEPHDPNFKSITSKTTKQVFSYHKSTEPKLNMLKNFDEAKLSCFELVNKLKYDTSQTDHYLKFVVSSANLKAEYVLKADVYKANYSEKDAEMLEKAKKEKYTVFLEDYLEDHEEQTSSVAKENTEPKPDTSKEVIEQLFKLSFNSKKLFTEQEKAFIKRIFEEIKEKASQKKNILSKTSYEKMGKEYGIEDVAVIKELTEFALFGYYKYLVSNYIPSIKDALKRTYDDIVEAYKIQPNISLRTSLSMLLQQYSTPAPIAFLASSFVQNKKKSDALYFEPSAGNGMMTLALNPKRVVVNEIDKVRHKNLENYEFLDVFGQDAARPLGFDKVFDGVVTNPPFGSLDTPLFFGKDYKINSLEQLMAIRALDSMRDDGKAAIIIGGHTTWDEKGRIQAGKNRIFFNYLHHYYHVVDTINIDGSLYSKQGTSFDIRLILIKGRKRTPEGFAPFKSEKDTVVKDFDTLFSRVEMYINQPEYSEFNGLEGVYRPVSDGTSLDTSVPDAMDYETHLALGKMKDAIGGDVTEYVREKLGYKTREEVYQALGAEQIDGVALAIYKIGQGKALVIGDQTGIGKGRQAAAIIRYGVRQGLKPIFITEKPNLFSDFYRDLKAIGSEGLTPFIVNAKESKTHIKNEEGVVIYKAPEQIEQNRIFKEQRVPSGYDFIMSTYSQFYSGDRGIKGMFLNQVAKNNIIVLDESHNASGNSNTGAFLSSVLKDTKGCLFLSATFAKRPDNMPIYALKTSISEANLSNEELVDAILRGGVALQEVLSSQLVSEGEMLRRERSYEGIEVNYIYLNEMAKAFGLEDLSVFDKTQYDLVIGLQQKIIQFQLGWVNKEIEKMDEILRTEGAEAGVRMGTEEMGVSNAPAFSRVFNMVFQLLFSIKAKTVAKRAIQRLKENKKPVIAFSSTMGAFLESLENVEGKLVKDGDSIDASYKNVIARAIESVMTYTVTLTNGQKEKRRLNYLEMPEEAQKEYLEIIDEASSFVSELSISPIDVVVTEIEKAGYKVAEVTGRKLKVEFTNTAYTKGIVRNRKKENTNDAFRMFNNDEVDVLLINQSGSTGASAHAIPTSKVARNQVRQRVMLILQAELDINKEIQKRGRINRTGQLFKPIYDYIISDIPAEKRLMMMLQKKLKSLDANTASNQKNSEALLKADDFLNKYGDEIALQYIIDDPDFALSIGIGIDEVKKIKAEAKTDEDGEEQTDTQGKIANKICGRVAVLLTPQQEKFYKEMIELYEDEVTYLKQAGLYDLEVENIDFKAEVMSKKLIIAGKETGSAFSKPVIWEHCQVDSLTKPVKRATIEKTIKTNIAKVVETNAEELVSGFVRSSLNSILGEVSSDGLEVISKNSDFEIGKTPDGFLYLKTPYNPELVARIKRTIFGAKWDGKYWKLPAHSEDDLKRILRDAYGHDGSELVETVDVIIDLDVFKFTDNGELILFGKPIVKRWYSSKMAQFPPYVSILSGGFPNTGGAYKHPKLNPKPGTKLLVKNISKAALGREELARNHTFTVYNPEENFENEVIQQAIEQQIVKPVEQPMYEGAYEYQKILTEKAEQYFTQKKIREQKEVGEEFDKKAQKLAKKLLKDSPNPDYTEEQAKEDAWVQLKSAYNIKLEMVKVKNDTLYKSFYVPFIKLPAGRSVEVDLSGMKTPLKGIVLGYDLKMGENVKTFIPSKVKLEIAVASPLRIIKIPFSKSNLINNLIVKNEFTNQDYLSNWDELVSKYDALRIEANILTGNLLTAMGKYKGKLISYTMKNGVVRKGLLVNESSDFDPKIAANFITVPIAMALPIIKDMEVGTSFKTSDGVAIFRQSGFYKIIVPSSRQTHGRFFLDSDILGLIDKSSFYKIGDSMVGEIDISKISQFVGILSNKFSSVIEINRNLASTYGINVDIDPALESELEAEEQILQQPIINPSVERMIKALESLQFEI